MDNIKSIFEEQCRELNMDHDTEKKAWKRFVDVAQRCNLEGDQSHWFACSLYASSRESWTPTVGSSDAVVMGNCVSLTKLLRCCNISIYEFISKIKRWHEMAKLPEEFRKQIELLERNFSITFCLYQRYKHIFQQLFAYSSSDKKNPKFRSVSKCSYGKLYDLCWCLFLCVKNESHDMLDFVTSFHLLICVIDLMYVNVLSENRNDLLNQQSFVGVAKKFTTEDNHEDFSIFGKLCEMSDIVIDDAKAVKADTFKSIMAGFFESNTIYGDSATFLGIISNQNFERNLKSLNCSYEQYILSVGTFDERLLLNNQNICHAYSPGSDEYSSGNADGRQLVITMSPDMSHVARRISGTEAENSCEKVKKLLEVTHICQPPEFLKNVGDTIVQKINERLVTMTKPLQSLNMPEAEQRLKIITSLYYCLLEKIIRIEVINKPHIDLKILLDSDSFHPALIICCAEIVLDSYNIELKFPWILDCLGENAFNFYRIIELVVGRHETLLNRMHIQHLNTIEESCLECLSWKGASPIWKIIAEQKSLPAWIDVDANTTARRLNNIQQHTNSPINSAFETFSGVSAADSARKDLFNTAKETAIDTNNARGTKNECWGSLKLFFRKFYKLAYQRIEKFCKELNMENDLKKIWTLFEYSIMQCTDLLRDRHLDQIIMCAIYIYIKVTELQNNNFTDIMKAYRKQPQSTSSVYREVLIEFTSPTNETNDRKPIYNDLIYFYNKVYVQKMTPYALGFSKKKTKGNDLLLSPHPTERQSAPIKISSTHKIFVSPMEKFDDIRHSPDSLIYGIGRSPAKDLQRMNDFVKRGKRNLPFNEDSSTICSKEPRLTPPYLPTIQVILNDRQSDLS